MRRKNKNQKNKLQSLVYKVFNIKKIKWIILLITIIPNSLYSQTQIDRLLFLQKNINVFTSSISILAGVKYANHLASLQEQVAGIQYNNTKNNIFMYYSQDGDEWLSEKNINAYYSYKAIKNETNNLQFGLNIHYHVLQFKGKKSKGVFNYSFNAKYQWYKNKWLTQSYLNIDNNAIPTSSSFRIGKHLTNSFYIEAHPHYHLDINLFSSVIRMKYILLKRLLIMYEQHITHWISEISLTYEHKRIQVSCQSKWHQYLGNIWNTFLAYKIKK